MTCVLRVTGLVMVRHWNELAVTLQRLERMAIGQTPSVVPDEVEDTNEGSEEIAQ